MCRSVSHISHRSVWGAERTAVTKCGVEAILDDGVACKVHSATTQCARERCRARCGFILLWIVSVVWDGRRQEVPNWKIRWYRFHFIWWKLQIEDLLVQKDLDVVFGEKPQKMSDAEWADLDRKAMSDIRLSLTKNVAFNNLKEKTAKVSWKHCLKCTRSHLLQTRCFWLENWYTRDEGRQFSYWTHQ